tara:strand:- start:210 stop:527 length:318 start_codon:yes stop_codon:yes gene_type:complete
MALKSYQSTVALNTLFQTTLINGLGESLKPRITSVGGLVTIYGSENEPVGLTLANIATKMALVGDDVIIKAFESFPNYIAVIQKSGTSTELVISCIEIDSIQTII